MRECLKCGGSALKDYAWGCEHDDGEREPPEPLHLSSMAEALMAQIEPGYENRSESYWLCGRFEHPTREGAIALWKEAERERLRVEYAREPVKAAPLDPAQEAAFEAGRRSGKSMSAWDRFNAAMRRYYTPERMAESIPQTPTFLPATFLPYLGEHKVNYFPVKVNENPAGDIDAETP